MSDKAMQLLEANSTELVNKSRDGRHYKSDPSKNRFLARRDVSVLESSINYNKLNMDELFKRDVLNIAIPVRGETDNYTVNIRMTGIINNIKSQNVNIINFKVVYSAVYTAYTSNDIYISCTCPDSKYRMNYWATRNNFADSGAIENRPSRITNPNDDLGAYCKHGIAVLTQRVWLQKIIIAIENYCKWMKRNKPDLYNTLMRDKIEIEENSKDLVGDQA